MKKSGFTTLPLLLLFLLVGAFMLKSSVMNDVKTYMFYEVSDLQRLQSSMISWGAIVKSQETAGDFRVGFQSGGWKYYNSAYNDAPGFFPTEKTYAYVFKVNASKQNYHVGLNDPNTEIMFSARDCGGYTCYTVCARNLKMKNSNNTICSYDI